MSNLETQVNIIIRLVHSGLTPDQACKELISAGIAEDEIRAARAEYDKRAGSIGTSIEPASLEEANLPLWYPGPAEDDRYWPALYRYLLQEKGWSLEVISSLDKASSKVVSLLQPPGLGQFSTRGLVLGYVQSGKTANFSAVIAKAADVNYKFFIVLSGITNSLRRQTQERLDQELINLNPEYWVGLTNAHDDFSARIGGNADAFLTTHHNQRTLCVVKKNAYRIRQLLRWLGSAHKEVLSKCPVLIIDDEADQASVNASGNDQKRTIINNLLLNLLSKLPKVAYVGYTATPFANIFIDPTIPQDLYPHDFIIDLPKPQNYFGPEKIFGRDPLSLDDPAEKFDGLDMIRTVEDDEVPLLKPHGQNDYSTFQPKLTHSLQTALRYFWLATSARAARDNLAAHSTMLIHTTLYAVVHDRFKPLIEQYRDGTLERLKQGDTQLIEEMRSLWEEEQESVPSEEVGELPTSFDSLYPHLLSVITNSKVVVENSRSDNRLDYGVQGRIQIVVGGNILSRGLTLEGLIVSFFVRAANAYDTLLQMGRWFGYRDGYADLPRIWMTEELSNYFFDLATVEQEMRNDIRRYELEQLTPSDFAVRIRTHPALSITSRMKMQAAIYCDVSYSGRRVQTILFNHKDRSWLEGNRTATGNLIQKARAQGITEEYTRGNLVLRKIPVEIISSFLSEYSFHENSLELKSDLLQGYIKAQNGENQLLEWNLVIIGRQSVGNAGFIELVPGLQVPLLIRSRLKIGAVTDNVANLGVIMSKVDLVADLDKKQEELVEKDTPALQEMRPEGMGLLVLYPISKDSAPAGASKGKRIPLKSAEHIIGVGLVFPKASNLTTQRSYMSVDLSKITIEEPEWPEEENGTEEGQDSH
jgi:hypothetical protein